MNMENKSTFSPLELDLVLTTLLNNLELKQLLNCRLVSHHWNSIAVNILSKRGCALSLDASNIDEFIISRKENVIKMPPLPIALYIKVVDINMTEILLDTVANIPLEVLQQQNITSIIYNTSQVDHFLRHGKNLINLVQAVAKRVKHLQIYLNFPSLENIFSTPGKKWKDEVLLLTNTILKPLSNSNLLKLSLILPYNCNWIGQVVQHYRTGYFRLLQMLEISVPNVNNFDLTEADKFSNLKMLKIHLGTANNNNDYYLITTLQFCKFISCCPNLEGLELYFHSSAADSNYMSHQDYWELNEEYKNFNSIKYFGVFTLLLHENDFTGGISSIVAENISIVVSELCPNLTSFSTDGNTWSCLAKLFSTLGGNALSLNCNFTPRVFRNSICYLVSTLTFIITTNSNNFHNYESYSKPFKFLFYKLFPNLTTLNIKMHYSELSSSDDGNEKLMVKHLFSLDNSLKSIRVTCYNYNWLHSAVIESKSSIVDKRKCLEKLEFRLWKSKDNVHYLNPLMGVEFYVKVLLELLPNLKSVCIDGDFKNKSGSVQTVSETCGNGN